MDRYDRRPFRAHSKRAGVLSQLNTNRQVTATNRRKNTKTITARRSKTPLRRNAVAEDFLQLHIPEHTMVRVAGRLIHHILEHKIFCVPEHILI